MTNDNKSKSSLKADPSRQAGDSIRGYEYQIWHSVHAWLVLKPDEVLFIEVAEDFDIISPVQATAVQTKDIASSITLNSRDCIKALENYWVLKEKNPGRAISYKFLTSTTIGIEREKPFGPNLAGIELWKQCSRDHSKISTLQAFLAEKSSLPDALKTVISEMDEPTFLDMIIKPVQWVTDAGDI
ncbi:unnamed protein product, partial [marine sediment metagenome]